MSFAQARVTLHSAEEARTLVPAATTYRAQEVE
jgi:hypothetical protein